MILNHLVLQNFRSYSKSAFEFSEQTTLIIGPNTSGKSNFIEAIYLLSTGKSFRAEKDIEMIRFGQNIGRVTAKIPPNVINEETWLEAVLSTGVLEGKIPSKKFLLNKIPKRRVDFAGILPSIIFSPEDLEILTGSPGMRRRFLDDALEQTDREYRLAMTQYAKAIRQRNALLAQVQETGIRNQKIFEYWDEQLIKNGQTITKKREAFIEFMNKNTNDIFDFVAFYDKSVISEERLLQYKQAEEASGVTLVGPHRDDFTIHMFDNRDNTTRDVKLFGSRGQKRLVILQMKLLQLAYVEKELGARPLLLLDDIFSELDSDHIQLVMEMVGKQQTIITTTHEEYVAKEKINDIQLIKLGK